jgi:predicted phage-related endonuclease
VDLEGLKRRQLGVGGSDAAALLGVPTARRTPLGVYESKVVPITALEPEDGFGPSFWGRTLESAIADVFLQRHPVDMSAVWIRPDTRHRPGTQLVATPDRLMYHPRVGEPGPVRGLEVKTADRSLSAHWGPSGGDKIPEEYWVQVQHYYMVLPTIIRFDVAVLIGGNDYREYEVKRDDSFCKDLLVAEQAWWERHVVPRLPPEPTSRDIATLKKLYPGTDGSEIDLTGLHWHQVLVDSKKAIATAEAVVEAAKRTSSSRWAAPPSGACRASGPIPAQAHQAGRLYRRPGGVHGATPHQTEGSSQWRMSNKKSASPTRGR